MLPVVERHGAGCCGRPTGLESLQKVETARANLAVCFCAEAELNFATLELL
jgi:hypothetical protein